MEMDAGPSILLWGGRSQARIVDAMISELSIGQTGIVFDRSLAHREPYFLHHALVTQAGELKRRLREVTHFVVCIGAEHGMARLKTAAALSCLGLEPVSVRSRQSFVDRTSRIGCGHLIMTNVTVHKFTEIGNQVVLNTSCTIDHECIIGDGVHIMGSAAIAGKVTIERFATVGTNATILPGLTIGEGSYVGAGAVVTKDVPPYTVVAGSPARHLRNHALKFDDADLKILSAPAPL